MDIPVVKQIAKAEEVGWVNPKWMPWNEAKDSLGISMEDIDDAEARLLRFAPFIMKCFPETKERNGLIESALTPIPKMQEFLNQTYGDTIQVL